MHLTYLTENKMLKDIEKYKWLVTHDFEVAKLAECDQVTWQIYYSTRGTGGFFFYPE